MGECCDMGPVKAQECVGRCKKMPAPLWWLSCKLGGIKWGIKAFIRRHKKSPMEKWAENEVRLAIEREQAADREDCEKRGKKYNPKDFSYGGEIYRSALRAYKSLLKDGHSGMSWAFTTGVLTRMMKNLPLTPLTGVDDEWIECGIRNADGVVDYQNCRKSSLFKHIHPDGTVTYNDVDRVVCVDAEDKGDTHHFGLCTSVVDELFPITFPYSPDSKPFKVVDRIFDSNGKRGEFDTVGILRVECPDGEVKLVDRYYKEGEKEWIAIGKDEFELRLQSYKDSLNNK